MAKPNIEALRRAREVLDNAPVNPMTVEELLANIDGWGEILLEALQGDEDVPNQD